MVAHRRLVAIMFTDLVGFTALAQSDEAQALRLLEWHGRLLRPFFPKHSGREIKTVGDSFLVEFDSALDASQCAIEIQKFLHAYNSSSTDEWKIPLRIGIHLGDVVQQDGDIFGDAVNIASRIEPLATPGGICVSQQVFDQVHNKVALRFALVPTSGLKNVQFETRVYRTVMPWEEESPARPDEPRTAVPDHTRIAVLPFANLSPDTGDEYFSDGITEELISSVSRIPDLEVISRTSVQRYKRETGKSAPDIGRELRVGSLLEGSVRKDGQRVRISAQLIDAYSDRHLWAESYERDLKDIFAIQKEIASRVAEALKVKLGPSMGRPGSKSHTPNVEAHLLYLKGLAAHRQSTREGQERSIEYFQRAWEKDPGYAAPLAAMANSFIQLGFFEMQPSREAFEKARELAETALRIDPQSAEARLALGGVIRNLDWDHVRAEEEFRKVVELSPSHSEAHQRLAMLLVQAGRREEALFEANRAYELDPLSATASRTRGNVFLYSRRYPEAIASFRVAIELDPNDASASHNLGLAMVQAGQVEEGILQMQKVSERTKQPEPIGLMELGYAYSKAGRIREAEELLALLRTGAVKNPGWFAGVAGLCASLGRTDEAIEALDHAVEQHAGFLKAHLKNDFVFDPLRQDPRFKLLLKRVGWDE